MSANTTSAQDWNPGQYQLYHAHRLRPALDLLSRIPVQSPKSVFDLGCGTGEVTALMAKRWPDAGITGIDNSTHMLMKAKQIDAHVTWQAMDVQIWQPEQPVDLIYSNAALQWLDGHSPLFKRLMAYLTPGGWLAVQMPQSWGMPSHRLMRESLANEDKGIPLGSAAMRKRLSRNWVETAAWYYDLLAPHARQLDVWETEYQQVLGGDNPVFEWVKATALRPVLDDLTEAESALFIADYQSRLAKAYPRREDGMTLYPFKRLFIVAQKQ